MKAISTIPSKQTFTPLGFSIRAVALVAALLGAFAASALAQPANDNFADATVIAGLPFTDSVDNTLATTESGEPGGCYGASQTVWYSFTPATNAAVSVDMAGSALPNGDPVLQVYRADGPGFGSLSLLQCAGFGGSFVLTVEAGKTYYVQAGDYYDYGGTLQVNLGEIVPPTNDEFANATPITSLPFTDTVDTTGATQEAGEPTPSCWAGYPLKTVWYAFTPMTSGSVSATMRSSYAQLIAAYTGNSLASLAEMGCGNGYYYGNAVLTFRANAGTTYFFQVAGLFGDGGPLQFQLDVAPAPVAGFYFYPTDPSIFDTVQFYDSSSDPGGVSFQSFTWNFGDGATATDGSPTHRYAADGDYTVMHTATTVDGRTSAPTSQRVHVQTHDVAVTKFSAPTAAKAGQTRSITVGVNSKRYAETVQVSLLKSLPGNCFPVGCFQEVGSLTQSVPVRPSNRTTDFNFSYTFTSDDAAIGKVTFAATASILNARDALPADNQALSSPTKVSR
jgi:PKD repeat protein